MTFAWPTWIGSPSQFALLLAFCSSVLLAWFRIWPKLRELNLTDQAKRRADLYGHIDRLTSELKDCQKNCDEQEVRLRAEIDTLRTKIQNEAVNRVQSEISLVNTLINVVDAPQLKLILSALEQRQILLQVVNGALNGKKKEQNDEGA